MNTMYVQAPSLGERGDGQANYLSLVHRPGVVAASPNGKQTIASFSSPSCLQSSQTSFLMNDQRANGNRIIHGGAVSILQSFHIDPFLRALNPIGSGSTTATPFRNRCGLFLADPLRSYRCMQVHTYCASFRITIRQQRDVAKKSSPPPHTRWTGHWTGAYRSGAMVRADHDSSFPSLNFHHPDGSAGGYYYRASILHAFVKSSR